MSMLKISGSSIGLRIPLTCSSATKRVGAFVFFFQPQVSMPRPLTRDSLKNSCECGKRRFSRGVSKQPRSPFHSSHMHCEPFSEGIHLRSATQLQMIVAIPLQDVKTFSTTITEKKKKTSSLFQTYNAWTPDVASCSSMQI